MAVAVNILSAGNYAKKLNTLVNVFLFMTSAVAIMMLANPGRVVLEGFLNLENAEVLLLFIGVLFVVNLYKQFGNIAIYFLYWTRSIKSARLSLILTSLVLSLLPVKGRTIVSAPIIGQIAEKNQLNKFSAALVDYIATHIVYFLLPIEGSVVVVLTTFAVVGYNLGTFISYMLPGVIFLIGVVVYYSRKTVVGQSVNLSLEEVSFSEAAKVTFPLIILMFCLYLFEMHGVKGSILLGILFFVGLTLYSLKPSNQQVAAAIKSMDKSLILTLVLIFLFAATVAQLPIVSVWAAQFLHSGFSLPIIIIASYFIGFFVGDSRGMAALAFPLLLPLVQVAPNAFQLIAISYAALYAGYIASPAHPCCHYAASYFEVPYIKVWSRITLYSAGAACAIITIALLRG